MTKILIAVAVIVFVILGKVASKLIYSDSATKRKFKNKKIIRIIDIEDGEKCVVEGKVLPDEEVVVTPVFRKQCVWFKLEVYYYQGDWEKVADERVAIDFCVEDYTGTTRIKGENLQVAADSHTKTNEGIPDDQLDSLLSFLKSRNVTSVPPSVINTKIKVIETWLPIDVNVVLKGKGMVDANRSRMIRSDLIEPLYVQVKEKENTLNRQP